jgi:uncharacterized membrane protein
MFGTFLLIAIAGFAIAFLLSVASFAKSMQYQHNFHTIRDYWKLNAYYDIGGLIFLIFVSFVLTVPGGDWVVSFFSGGQIPANTPAGLYIAAFFLGAVNQLAISKLRGILKPKQYEAEQ